MSKLISMFFFIFVASATAHSKQMTAHYVGMGQADSTLLQFDCGLVLIDAGAQVQSGEKSSLKLTNYLDNFFNKNPQYNNTIDTILITHNHADHTDSLDEVAEKYNVKNIVSTAFKIKDDVEDVVAEEPNIKHKYLTYNDAQSKMPNGLHYSQIDPLSGGCSVDPDIRVYTGQSDVTSTVFVNNQRFTKTAFNNPNNNSLVIKVSYGRASFLFTGDLQDKGIEYLLANYADNLDKLQADVYQVGHHGSHNATTKELLEAVKPKVSVISAGRASDQSNFSAFAYGHPNKETVKLLEEFTHDKERENSIVGLVFEGSKSLPYAREISKEVYCTCWEGNIKIIADSETGEYTVKTNQ